MTRQEFDLVVGRLEVLFERPCPTWLKEERWEIWKNRSKDNLLNSIVIDPELNPEPTVQELFEKI
jgi:hypothetical protein